MPHRCPAPGCNINLPNNRFMCMRHWQLLPAKLRSKITYGVGPLSPWSLDGQLAKPSRAMLKAIQWLTDHDTRRKGKEEGSEIP